MNGTVERILFDSGYLAWFVLIPHAQEFAAKQN